MSTRVLLVGQGLFRDGLAHMLAQEPTVTIVGSENTWPEAQALVARLKPDVLIVDHAATALREAEMTPLLGLNDQTLKVIHLTLAENKMVVYDRRHVANVSLTNLLQRSNRPRKDSMTTTAIARPTQSANWLVRLRYIFWAL